jgi:hypothetical protein
MSNTCVHTIFPGAVPQNYFTERNVKFVQNKITEVLGREFKQDVIVDKGSILRVMQRIIEKRIESIPKMNQRVVMELCNEIRNHQINNAKHYQWEEDYYISQQLIDREAEMVRYDPQMIKLNDRGSGIVKMNKGNGISTVRFYFT